MAKQHKYNLVLDTDYDYDLIGICSHHSDYRLVWGINELLGLGLAKPDDKFVITGKKGAALSEHSYYLCSDEDNFMDFYLIKNKGEGKFLIPEKQQVDYFLFLLNNQTVDVDQWVEKLRGYASVLAAYRFDPTEFSSTENIVF